MYRHPSTGSANCGALYMMSAALHTVRCVIIAPFGVPVLPDV